MGATVGDHIACASGSSRPKAVASSVQPSMLQMYGHLGLFRLKVSGSGTGKLYGGPSCLWWSAAEEHRWLQTGARQ